MVVVSRRVRIIVAVVFLVAGILIPVAALTAAANAGPTVTNYEDGGYTVDYGDGRIVYVEPWPHSAD